MLALRNIIQKIEEKDSKELLFWLRQSDAEKCAQLFLILREGKVEEYSVAKHLALSPSAYYSLKSRLHSKIQDFFSHSIPDINIDLLKNVANIPRLLYNTPREIAIAHLLKLEKELTDHDMPYALTEVYSALKKLTRYSKKYFEYTQLYNKHMAYTMAIDKAKELLVDFNKVLGEFLMSRDMKQRDLLRMIQKEMYNYAQLYDSHRLMVYKNILDVEFALFTSIQPEALTYSVEEILIKTQSTINLYKNDANYSFLSVLIDFLWFEYCCQYKLFAKAEEYFLMVNDRLPIFLLNNFNCFPSVFLLSKAERFLAKKQKKALYDECNFLTDSYSPDPEDAPNYINFFKFQAICSFYAKKYNESISLLNDLMGTISFRSFPYAEIELKIFLAVCYLMAKKQGLADAMVKNVQRKLREVPANGYENARVFVKMLAVAFGMVDGGREKKLIKLSKSFLELNKGEYKMLEFIPIDEAFLKILSSTEKV